MTAEDRFFLRESSESQGSALFSKTIPAEAQDPNRAGLVGTSRRNMSTCAKTLPQGFDPAQTLSWDAPFGAEDIPTGLALFRLVGKPSCPAQSTCVQVVLDWPGGAGRNRRNVDPAGDEAVFAFHLE